MNKLLITASILSLTVACGKKDEPKGEPKNSNGNGSKQAIDAAIEDPKPKGPMGTVKGMVKLTGQAPEMKVLRRGSDRICAETEASQETVLVGSNGGLNNVVVRIKPGQVEGPVPKKPVVVDQEKCMYRPRVQAAVAGQPMLLKNSDKTFHNIHARDRKFGDRQGVNTLFNRGQPPEAPAVKGKIEKGIDVVELKCDAHGWMKGFIVVGDNPFFGVSAGDGEFSFAAPVGTHKIQTWHELYGMKNLEVTVEEGKEATLEVVYDVEKDGPKLPTPDGAPKK